MYLHGQNDPFVQLRLLQITLRHHRDKVLRFVKEELNFECLNDSSDLEGGKLKMPGKAARIDSKHHSPAKY